MEDISNLIKEAKPLYFARKRRNNVIKGFVAMFLCVAMIGVFYPKDVTYYDLYEDEIRLLTNNSIISDMGLPTDDFGLLLVF